MKSVALGTITSRQVAKTRPKRLYGCPYCKRQEYLRPGMHWHRCHGHDWRLEDVALVALIDSSIGSFKRCLHAIRVLSEER